MTTMLEFATIIDQPPEAVFDLLCDLRNYDEWLPQSMVFRGTSEISPGPIFVGSTYVERSPWGVRRGTVTVIDRPSLLCFVQPMTLRPGWLGWIDISLDHEFRDLRGATELRRRVSIAVHGPARLLSRAIEASFTAENERMIALLERHFAHWPEAHANDPVGG